jgi:hypothetical protein
MSDHEILTKRAPREFWLYDHRNDNRRGQFAEERPILELISLGAPLPEILNRLCIMIDVRIGNVVSIVSLPHGDENQLCSFTRSAMQMGLHVFSSTSIVSRDHTLLGTLELYSCDPRRPTALEYQLIERVAHLAAMALQRREEREDSVRSYRRLSGGIGGVLERLPFIN